MPELGYTTTATSCARCGTEVAPGLLACPACGRLVHAEALSALAQQAEAAQSTGDRTGAIDLWKQVLALVPLGTRQHETVAKRIFDLEQAGPAVRPAEDRPGKGGIMAGAGAVIIFLLTKAKFLLLGLTKLSTLSTMVLSLGYYMSYYGWRFAAALIASIYIHEMGHVWKLRQYGVHATAPMFIPGFGALIRSGRAGTLEQEARIGLWGPLWGLAAPVAAAAIYFATHVPLWAVVAQWGAYINLFNLLPVWQLDGGHAYNAFSRQERWIALGMLGLAWVVSHHPMLLLVMLGAGWQLFRPAPERGDRNALLIYLGLAWAFAHFMVILPVMGPGR